MNIVIGIIAFIIYYILGLITLFIWEYNVSSSENTNFEKLALVLVWPIVITTIIIIYLLYIIIEYDTIFQGSVEWVSKKAKEMRMRKENK